MTLDRLVDHVARAASFRALHGVPPWAAALLIAAIAAWIILSARRKRP